MQRKWFKAITKVISLLLTLTFVTPYLLWAFEPSAYPLGQGNVILQDNYYHIPKQLGQVVDHFQGHGPTVVYIQDLHCQQEVQLHIAGLLDQLVKENHIKLIGVEGASETLDVSKLRTFPLQKVKELVGRHFIRTGQMSGAEYYAATGDRPVILQGVENQALYDSSRQAIETFFTSQSQGLIWDLRDALESLKKDIYHQDLKDYDQKVVTFKTGKWPLLKYAAYLYETAQAHNLPLSAYPEIKKLISKRRNVLPLDVDQDLLIQETDNLDVSIRRSLYQSQWEKALDQRLRQVELMEKLLNVSATTQELSAFQKERAQFKIQSFLDFMQQAQSALKLKQVHQFLETDLFRLDDALDQVAGFYKQADQRSEAFVANLLKDMHAQGQDQAVLLSGGYHQTRILECLKEQDVSYISIKPRMTKVDLINPYFALLRHEKTPLEKLLAHNQNLIALASGFKPMRLAGVPDKDLPSRLRSFAAQLDMTAKTAAAELKIETSAITLKELQIYVQQQMARYDDNDPAIAFDWAAAQANETTKTYLVPIKNTEVTALFSPRRTWKLGIGLTTNLKLRYLSNQEAKENAQAILSTPAWFTWSQAIGQGWRSSRVFLKNFFNQIQSLLLANSGFIRISRLRAWLQAHSAQPAQWPYMEKWLYQRLEKVILWKAGSSPPQWRLQTAWFISDVLAPALVESVFFVGGGTVLLLKLTGQPLAMGPAFWGIFIVLNLVWHVVHGFDPEKKVTIKIFTKSAFLNMPNWIITGFNMIGLAILADVFNPTGPLFLAWFFGILFSVHIFLEARPHLINFWGEKFDLWRQFSVSEGSWQLENVIASLWFWISRIRHPGDIKRQIKMGKWGLFLDIGGIIALTLLTGIFFPGAGFLGLSLPLFLYTALLQGLKTIDLIVHGGQPFHWFHVLQFIVGFLKQLVMLLPYLPVLILYHDDILMLHIHIPLVSLVFWGINILYYNELRTALAYKTIDVKKEMAYDNPSWTKVKGALSLVAPAHRKEILKEIEAIIEEKRLTLGDVENAQKEAKTSGQPFEQYWDTKVQEKTTQIATILESLVEKYNDQYLEKESAEVRQYFWLGMVYNMIFRYGYDPKNTQSNLETFYHSFYMSEYVAGAGEEYGVANGVHELPQADIERLRRGAWVHDVGKLLIPPKILYMRDKPNEEQIALMKAHSLAGEFLLPAFGLDPEIVKGTLHHLGLDGRGYPTGREDIPLTEEQKAYAVVDRFEAVTSNYRSYRADKPLHYRMPFELMKMAAKGIVDKKWVNALARAAKMHLKRPDIDIFVKPEGYTALSEEELEWHHMASEVLLYGTYAQQAFPLYSATMGKSAGLDESVDPQKLGGRLLLDENAGDLALVNGMMTIVGNSDRMDEQRLRGQAHVMLDIIKREKDFTQMVTYAAFYTLQTIKNKLPRPLKREIDKLAGDRNKYTLLDLIPQDAQLARIRQFLTEDELPLKLLETNGDRDPGININIVGGSLNAAAQIAAVNPRHHVIVSKTHFPDFEITDNRESLRPKKRRVAYFEEGKPVAIYDFDGRPDAGVLSYMHFKNLYKKYTKDKNNLPAGITAEKMDYDALAWSLGIGLKHNAFGIDIKCKIKICLNELGTYPGMEEKYLTLMSNDNSLREGGIIITGNPLLPLAYKKGDCQFTVYQKKDGKLSPVALYLIKDNKRYDFPLTGKSITEAERLGHAIIWAMQYDGYEQRCKELGFNKISNPQDLAEPQDVDLDKWQDKVAASLKEKPLVAASSLSKKNHNNAERHDQDDDQQPPVAPGGDGGDRGGSDNTTPSGPSQNFSMVEEANQPFYTQLSMGQRVLRWLLAEFIFSAGQEGDGPRQSLLGGLGLIFGLPLMGLRLLVNTLINQPLPSGIKIDAHNPVLTQLLRQNQMPDPMTLQAAIGRGHPVPGMDIRPLSQLSEKRSQDWEGRLVLAGDQVGGRVFTQTVLFLPDGLLAAVAQQPEASSWLQGFKKAAAKSLLSACLSQLSKENAQRWEVDLLMEGVARAVRQAPSAFFRAVFRNNQYLPHSLQPQLQRLLRTWNAPAYLNLVLAGQHSPLAAALTGSRQPLAKAYELWATTGNLQMRRRFEERLQDIWQMQAQAATDEEKIRNLLTLSSLTQAVPDLGAQYVGEVFIRDSLKDVYLPVSMLEGNVKRGRMLDQLKPLLQVIDQKAFEQFRTPHQERSLKTAV